MQISLTLLVLSWVEPMVFQGEEIFQGIRGWTYGYDYYAGERSVSFHIYAVNENAEKRKAVKTFWENKNLFPGAAEEAMKRLNGIIKLADSSVQFYDGKLEEYGIGSVRTPWKFFKLFGINPEKRTVEDDLCTFVRKRMMMLFKPFLRDNGMGIDYTQTDFGYKALRNKVKII